MQKARRSFSKNMLVPPHSMQKEQDKRRKIWHILTRAGRCGGKNELSSAAAKSSPNYPKQQTIKKRLRPFEEFGPCWGPDQLLAGTWAQGRRPCTLALWWRGGGALSGTPLPRTPHRNASQGTEAWDGTDSTQGRASGGSTMVLGEMDPPD